MEVLTQNINKKIPQYVFKVAEILRNNGYKAYLVGGAVRDLLLGRLPKDYDISTDALPEQMDQIFDRCITTNARFGTVLVIMESETLERFDVEVTTFRREEDYYAGRWPSKVEFTSDIIEDLSRRDFTINAMAVDLNSIPLGDINLADAVIDPFGGLKDISDGIIRAVRDPLERFTEDGLRAYKACRMASELSFKLEDKTFNAINQTLNVAGQISMERVRDEFVKCVKHSPKPSVGIELMRKSGLLKLFLPELLDTINVTQPEFHEDDVYTHSLKVLDLAEDSIKIAGLLHDIGKGVTQTITADGKVHFYGHDQKGAEITEKVLKRLKFSNQEINRISSLVRWHMFYYPSASWRKENDLINLFNPNNSDNGGWTDAAIRRFIKKVGEDLIDDLFKLRIADASANPKTLFDPKEIEALQKRISFIKEQDMALKVTDLAINGKNLIEMGVTPGPMMGSILNELLEKVIDDPQINNEKDLIALAKEMVV